MQKPDLVSGFLYPYSLCYLIGYEGDIWQLRLIFQMTVVY